MNEESVSGAEALNKYLDKVTVELDRVHEVYASPSMRNRFVEKFVKDPKKSLRSNVGAFITEWEAEHTDTNTDAGYWVHKWCYEPQKARKLAFIAGDYEELDDDEVIETYDNDSRFTKYDG